MPWWVERVSALLEPPDLGAIDLGALWRLSENLRFVRDNVEVAHLEVDFARAPSTSALWQRFLLRERQVRAVLGTSRDHVRRSICLGELAPAAFRATWQALGYVQNALDSGTPADDYLDGLLSTARVADVPLPSLANPNIGSRAKLTAEFLAAIEPSADDVVFDLGAGSGKLALTVAMSTLCRVVGVECCDEYVEASRGSARALSLENLRLDHGDARDVDLSEGSIFYLYHPFRGEVARLVAERLGALGKNQRIRIFSSGPTLGYGEFFLREVDKGNLALRQRRGEFSQALVLSSVWD